MSEGMLWLENLGIGTAKTVMRKKNHFNVVGL